MKRTDLIKLIKEPGLRATSQRIAILDTLSQMKHHPTAEQVLRDVRRNHPEISLATIYNTLDAFVRHGIIHRVKTDKDTMRYDAIPGSHHHLYCQQSDRIEDYINPDLQVLIEHYFSSHHIPGFKIEDIRLQIIGEFTK